MIYIKYSQHLFQTYQLFVYQRPSNGRIVHNDRQTDGRTDQSDETNS